MRKALILLAALSIFAGVHGCRPGKQSENDVIESTSSVSRVSIDELKAATVSFFVRTPKHLSEVEAEFVGCGVLASSFQSGQRRYFIVTTSHMMQANDVVKNGQIGLCATHDNRIIKRLHVPINGIGWKEPDLRSGLILGDLTAALSDIENIGVKIRCVDLDIVGTTSRSDDEYLISRVGVAIGSDFKKLGISKLSTGILICADPDKTRLINQLECFWTSPTVDKHFALSQTFIQKLHSFKDASGKFNRIDKLTVHELDGQAVIGNSGAPAYFAMDDGSYQLAGIVSGIETNKV